MKNAPDLNQLSEQQLRDLAAQLLQTVQSQNKTLVYKEAVIQKLTYEMANVIKLSAAPASRAQPADFVTA